MFLLLISLAALALGPIVYRAAGSARSSIAALDGFVVIAIAGLVGLHIIPHAVATAGLGAIGIALIGLLGPGLVERSLQRAARHAHAVAMAMAILGLTVHAFFDGVALAGGDDHAGDYLALAVVLHRLPVSITVWSLLRQSRGTRTAVTALIALAAATVGGFATSDQIVSVLADEWLGYFQALVAGSVLHVVFHRPHPDTPNGRDTRIPAGVGALAALGMVVALSETHLPLHAVDESLDVAATFIALSLESAPALLLAFAMAGLVQVLLPHASLRWMRTGNPMSESVRGMVFGLPLPICSCGVIPIYESLVKRAVPATAAMAFLVATPELGLDAILISIPLLGLDLAIARLVAAAAVALLVGWWIGRLADAAHPAHGDIPPPEAQVAQPVWTRIKAGLRFGFGEIVDHTGPWILLGLAIASLVEPMLHGQWIAALPFGVDVVLFALLGMPSYVCASGATPFVAVLIHKGVSPGAAIAFLLTGPATNVTTFGILSRLHGRRVALAFGGVVAGAAIALGFAVNAALPDVGGFALHEVAGEEASTLATASLIALGAIYLVSLLRQGPRGFIGQILAPHGGHHDHDHGHDHGHDHDHGQGHGHDCC